MDGENFSAFELLSLTPFVNPFFRLERSIVAQVKTRSSYHWAKGK
jgi:hypothetical protein